MRNMYSKETLVNLHKSMVRIRFSEESLVEPILNEEFKCPVHLYTGQEAIAAGVGAALSDEDYIFGTHRSHGHYLAKGGGLKEMIAEIYGKDTGCSRGRGGSMHLYSPEKGFCGSAPIVAGTISLALGSALASSIRKDRRVTVSFFGDGAAGEGVLYESLNFAALKKLPIIFACENNLYSTHLPIRECRPNDNIYQIAEPFGIESHRIDGNDVLQVYEAAKNAVQQCRNNQGPVFLEFMTYRMRGHVGPNDKIQEKQTDIRPKAEIKKWEKKNPIEKFRRYLLENNILEEKDLNRIEREINEEIADAYLFAKESPHPLKNELIKYVFKN
ncbi:MAG: thiamine pyrophosphate-dependent dehydrogenase E1 component subunit alpha [candidate division Zixibacteria bacterium]|nr:thiamine pyrophosphate-dependent dehydrogenase E1 component subunit alpha [Candidatus Tariuqbacter arcticus]